MHVLFTVKRRRVELVFVDLVERDEPVLMRVDVDQLTSAELVAALPVVLADCMLHSVVALLVFTRFLLT